MYRKYLEPAYGEPRPEVNIGQPQIMDLENPGPWRNRCHLETVQELTALMRQCRCYDEIMAVTAVNTWLDRDGTPIPLRVYRPEGEGPFPVMVFYHGGGWSMNNLDIYDYVPRYFTRYGGVVVVAVDYRLAPEHKFPTGVEDAYAALEWAAAHAPEYGGDPDCITVCGDSAGGNFAAAVSLMARDRKGPGIRKQVLIYPATTFHPGGRTQSELRYGSGGYFLDMDSTKGLMCAHYFEKIEDSKSPYASPMLAETLKGLPPAVFLSAECDTLLDQALMYAARLEDEGVPVEYHLYTGMIHAFINRTYQKSFEAMDDIIAALPRPGQ